MELSIGNIVPCLWFDNQAEEAARYYCSIFADSKILRITRYGKEGVEIHRRLE
jgi:predicted 3-demethylubiquinone-9 3-methyltransferase (glyoxalase superfamily)